MLVALSMRQRALLAFQNKANNQARWKQEDDWLAKKRKSLSTEKPSKSQKSGSLMERMAKLNATVQSEESWRSKLAEQNKKNLPSSSLSSRSEPKEMKCDESGNGPNTNSQQAIIRKLERSANEWKQRQNAKDDAMLQALRQKTATKQERKNMAAEHQRKVALETERWRERMKGNASSTTAKVTVNLSERVKELESKEKEWSQRYSSTARKELEEQALRANVHDAVNANIDKFLEIAQNEKEDPNAWKQRLQKASNPGHDHLTLLQLQIRKLNSKMGQKYESEVARSQSEQFVSGQPDDIESIEVAFEERLSQYQTELLNIQSRFEAQIAYFKDLRTENDSHSFEAMDPEKRAKAQLIMEQQVAARKSKMADHKLLEEATQSMNRENCFKVLRDLGILVDDDTVINMNNCRILETLTDSKRIEMKNVLRFCIEDNPRLVSIQLANAKLDDAWFTEDILPAISEHAKMLTELLLDSNPLKDKSIKALTEYIASNPPCLRALRFKNLYHDITTPVIKGFLDALEGNSQLIKVVMDTRFFQQRDKLQRVMDRNWKRYAQERRLKKTMLTQIQQIKQSQ